MFCPSCKDEFRPGFTHCATCDVDLVESLSDVAPAAPAASEARAGAAGGDGLSSSLGGRAPAPVVVALRDYCGFTTLDDAREARDRLQVEEIYSEIVVRQRPHSEDDPTLVEEFWLRVDGDRFREVFKLLGIDEVPADEALSDESFSCGDCGAEVSSSETFCSACGARFEDD
jgi:hypothetical protein